MTTQNHTAIGAGAALLAANQPTDVKIWILVGLVLSHIIADLIPHLHFYSFEDLKKNFNKNAFGAGIELGGGLVVIPLIVYFLTNIDLSWLMLCVFASSAFDFAVAAKIQPIIELNEMAHWWKKFIDDKTPNPTSIAYETIQTIILFGGLIYIIRFH